jgi:lysophospholipase L1-like esterase
MMRTFLSHRKTIAALIGIFLLVSAELLSRFVLGLGTPPLYVADPQIEYMLKPDQNVRRFGNHILVNHWGMRSPDFPLHKTNPDEIRILVMGDSVINGGSVIDQALLSTSLLQKRLQASLGRPVVIGNASAGSWGPGNWLAYVQRYGFFDADLVLLLVNSGDYADNPTFAPLDANHPDTQPLFALQEAVFRYLPGYLPTLTKATANQVTTISPAEVARGRSDLGQFLSLAEAGSTRKVMVFHHPDRPEFLANKYLTGHAEMRVLSQELDIPFIDLYPAYAKQGANLYRDGIHHNVQGQKVLADALHDAVLARLASPAPPAVVGR